MMAVGHSPAPVVDAIAQIRRRNSSIPARWSTTYEPYVRLAELLNEIAPGSFRKKTILANSGAEAVENAVKLSRKFTGRPG